MTTYQPRKQGTVARSQTIARRQLRTVKQTGQPVASATRAGRAR